MHLYHIENEKLIRMQNYSDEELVAKYKESRDHQYLTVLFTRHSDIIYRNVLRKMRNPSDAEDVVQTAYCKMIAGLLQYKGTGSVLGWMLQVSLYTCYEVYRSEKGRINREKKVMAERVKEVKEKNYELTEMIENHLNKLPEIYKVPITLQIMDGLTIKEVAEVLEKSEKTVRSQIARGLEKLKVSLQNVGVTASVVSIGEVLKEIQLPVAPETIKSSQFFNSLYQQKALASAKLAVTTSAKSFLVQKIVIISLLVAGSIGGVLFFNKLEKKTKATSIPTIIKKWDFENTKVLADYQDIGLLNGAIAIEKSMGENQSNGLMVEEKSILELDISKYKMPLKISYKTNYYFPKDTTLYGQMVVKSNYLKDQKVFFFTAVRERIKAEYKSNKGKIELNGNWYSNVFYIDEKSIDFWVEGQRSQVLLGQSSQNNKVYLSIYGKAIIDNLKIESIEENTMPNKSLFEKVALTMELKEGSSVYSIEKEKLGISKNSTANPQLDIMTATDFEKNIGANLEKIYPSLNKDQKVVWVNKSIITSQKWDFEKAEDLQHFNLIHGMFAHGVNKGVNQSNCIGVNAETVLEFDISEFKLPIKISYMFKIPNIDEEVSKGCLFAKGNYQKNKNILLFTKLSPPQVPEMEGGWFRSTTFVTEKSIDHYLNDSRTGITIGQSVDNKKLYVYWKDVTHIDDFLIESVLPENTPSVNEFIKFGESIPLEKKFKNYYPLGKEKLALNLDANSKVELGICTSEVMHSSFYLDKKLEVIPINPPTKVLK